MIVAIFVFQFFAPTGSLNRDCDDVRKFGEAATKGIKRCV